MAYTASDLLNATLKLLPVGRMWNKALSSNMAKTIALYMPGMSRITYRGDQLLVDSFPATTYELLPEWELSLGLPDPCQGPNPTIDARRRQVVAKFTDTGGQSVPHYQEFLGQLGYNVTITEHAQFRAGLSRIGDAVSGSYAPFQWTVVAPPVNGSYFRTGVGVAGELLATYGNAVLECEVRTVAPSHTLVDFAYVAPVIPPVITPSNRLNSFKLNKSKMAGTPSNLLGDFILDKSLLGE